MRRHSAPPLAIAVAFLAVEAVNATPGYFSAPAPLQWPLITVPASDVATADLDGNGREDFVFVYRADSVSQPARPQHPRVVLNEAPDQLRAVLNEPLGSTEPVPQRAIAIADFDGNGTLDLAVAGGERDLFDNPNVSLEAAEDRVYFNSGDWTNERSGFDFGNPTGLGAPSVSRAVAAGDIDGDGDQDIAIGTDEDGIRLWINQGGLQGGAEGNFSLRTSPGGTSGTVLALAIGDLDDVVGPEIVASVATPLDVDAGSTIDVWLNDGQGAFSAQPSGIDTDGSGQVVALQVLSKDYGGSIGQRFWLAVGATRGTHSGVYRALSESSNPVQEFTLIRSLGSYLEANADLQFVDVNEDGNEDLVLVSNGSTGAEVGVYLATRSSNDAGFAFNDQCFRNTGFLALLAVPEVSGGEGPDLYAFDTIGSTARRLYNRDSPATQRCCISEVLLLLFGRSDGGAKGDVGRWLLKGNAAVQSWLAALFYLEDIRTRILPRSPGGVRYTGLYQTHEAEIKSLFRNDRDLAFAWGDVLTSWELAIYSLREEADADQILTAQQMSSLQMFLDALRTPASAALARAIDDELALLAPLSSYAGSTMRDFRADTVGLTPDLLFADSFEP